jgi:hypothetical protein
MPPGEKLFGPTRRLHQPPLATSVGSYRGHYAKCVVSIVECLLSHGADPNIQTNENGSSVLAGMAYVNQLKCVRLLLHHGADPNRGRNRSGETPLHHALSRAVALGSGIRGVGLHDRTPCRKVS